MKPTVAIFAATIVRVLLAALEHTEVVDAIALEATAVVVAVERAHHDAATAAKTLALRGGSGGFVARSVALGAKRSVLLGRGGGGGGGGGGRGRVNAVGEVTRGEERE